MAWFLFLLAVAFIAAAVVWNYRKKAALRESVSKERFERIFKTKASTAPASESNPAGVPDTGVGSMPTAPVAAATRPAGERFLGRSETLIYFLLKTGLPDHEVFANVSLASVVGAPGGESEREQQVRRLSQYRLDFVVCDRDMRITAVVEVEAPGGADAAGTQRFKSDCLKTAGIRLVRINPASPPRRKEIRALICGGPGAAGT